MASKLKSVTNRTGRIAALESELASRDERIAALQSAVAERDGRISVLEGMVASNHEVVTAISSELKSAQANLKAYKHHADSLNAVYVSTSWQLTKPLRQALDALNPAHRDTLRRAAKLLYWLLTPHRLPSRLRLIRTRNQEMRKRSLEVLPADHLLKRRSDSVLWFYIGDTIDWLQTHDRITGIGRVTCELFLASLKDREEGRFVPCIRGATPSSLVQVSYREIAPYLSSHFDARSFQGLLEPIDGVLPPPVQPSYPRKGDHVVFTGAIWSAAYADLFIQLNQVGVGISVFVYDIIPIERPDLVGAADRGAFERWLETVIAVASVIHVSSAVTKNQIVRWAVLKGCDVRADIIVTEFGSTEPSRIADAEELRSSPRTTNVDLQSFVLSVGTIDKRKNQALLCHLWPRLISELGENTVPQLVLVGRDDLGLGNLDADFSKLLHEGKILVLEGVEDAELFGLYRACLFTVFPSLSEGYGLPVAESLGSGKLCLTADLPAIREHASDLPWYFDPTDEEAALMLLRRAIEHQEQRVAAELRISEKHRPRSWASTFQTIVAAAWPEVRISKKYRTRALASTFQTIVAAVLSGKRKEPDDNVVPAGRPQPGFLSPVLMTVALAKAQAWCTSESPDVSILVVNRNTAQLTLECIRQILANTDAVRYEIIVADNGSDKQDLAALKLVGQCEGFHLLEIGCNRYFGEANNIAAEHAKGHFICLLNNNAFVRPNWLRSLVDSLEKTPEAGACGPLMLLPNKSVQQAGAIVNESGIPIPLGHGGDRNATKGLVPRFVDYISTTALLLSHEAFMEVGGFDPVYEPAYYEDVDLCFKLQANGKKILFCPDAIVIAAEQETASEAPLVAEQRNILRDINRNKFAARWDEYLGTRSADAARRVVLSLGRQRPISADTAPARSVKKSVAIYTPFPLIPGGGERFILTLASALSRDFAVTIVTPHPYSRLRLQNMDVELGIDLSCCDLMAEREFRAVSRSDLMVTLGNHIVPPIELMAKRGMYVCQFPFRLSADEIARSRHLASSYKEIIVYSEYTRANVYSALSAFQMQPIPIRVLHPPVPQLGGDACVKENRILSVGRFFDGGHCKRHDVMIEVFRALHERVGGDIELHLAGSSAPTNIEYLDRLRQLADGFPIFFHVNVPVKGLHQLYREAAVYWHATGIYCDLNSHPEQAEHFGISLVEAMSAECVPLAFNAGGPREIIQHSVNGFLYKSVGELLETTLTLFDPTCLPTRHTLARAARKRAAIFSEGRFIENVRKMVAEDSFECGGLSRLP